MPFIGIDLGTSFIKGAVLDLEACELKHIHRLSFPQPLPSRNPLFCEFDPDEIISAFQNLLDTLIALAPDCSGAVICSQMHGMVLMNEAGEVRSPCLTWRDQRATMPHPSGEGTFFEVMSRRIPPEHRAQLGNELRPGTPSSFLFWLAERGELPPDLIPASIPDFLLSKLTGSRPSVESTNGMAYGLLNLERMDWHRGVIEALGLHRLAWPKVRKQGEVVGHLQRGTRSIPVHTPFGDYQCALVGALLDERELSLNISTGSQVSRLTGTLTLGDCQTRPFFDGKFLNTFTHIPAGRALDVLVGLVTEVARKQKLEMHDPWSFVADQTMTMADTDLQVDLNFFSSPFGDRGMISNIRQDNLTVGHLFLGAFKNMAERYYHCAERIWPDRAWQKLVFSGGLPGKIGALRRVIQNRFDADYRLAPFAEDTLTGLLILALAFSGRSSSVDQAMDTMRRGIPV